MFLLLLIYFFDSFSKVKLKNSFPDKCIILIRLSGKIYRYPEKDTILLDIEMYY